MVLVTASATATDLAPRDKAAKAISMQLIKQLGGKLKQEMKASGPTGAISVCKDAAPAIARDLSLEHGWKVTRVSNKARNPLLGTPDAWEHQQLDAFEQRKSSGEKPADMFTSEITEESGRRYYRFIKPLGTKKICLACHGDDATVPAPVQARLKQEYPFDRARGYKAGDIRGAISIKQLLVNDNK
jgi:cytochrome c553